MAGKITAVIFLFCFLLDSYFFLQHHSRLYLFLFPPISCIYSLNFSSLSIFAVTVSAEPLWYLRHTANLRVRETGPWEPRKNVYASICLMVETESFKIAKLDTSEATTKAVSALACASALRPRDDELDGLGNKRMRK